MPTHNSHSHFSVKIISHTNTQFSFSYFGRDYFWPQKYQSAIFILSFWSRLILALVSSAHWFIWADLGFGNSPLKNAVFSLGRQQLIVFCNLWALESQIWKKFLATEKTAHELWSRVPDVCTQKTFYNRQNEKCYKNGLSLIVFPWRIKWRRRSLEIFATFIFQSHVCC